MSTPTARTGEAKPSAPANPTMKAIPSSTVYSIPASPRPAESTQTVRRMDREPFATAEMATAENHLSDATVFPALRIHAGPTQTVSPEKTVPCAPVNQATTAMPTIHSEAVNLIPAARDRAAQTPSARHEAGRPSANVPGVTTETHTPIVFKIHAQTILAGWTLFVRTRETGPSANARHNTLGILTSAAGLTRVPRLAAVATRIALPAARGRSADACADSPETPTPDPDASTIRAPPTTRAESTPIARTTEPGPLASAQEDTSETHTPSAKGVSALQMRIAPRSRLAKTANASIRAFRRAETVQIARQETTSQSADVQEEGREIHSRIVANTPRARSARNVGVTLNAKLVRTTRPSADACPTTSETRWSSAGASASHPETARRAKSANASSVSQSAEKEFAARTLFVRRETTRPDALALRTSSATDIPGATPNVPSMTIAHGTRHVSSSSAAILASSLTPTCVGAAPTAW